MKNKTILSLVVTTSLLLSACGGKKVDGDITTYSKDELISMYKLAEENFNGLKKQLDDTQLTLKQLVTDGTVEPAITVVGDGTGRLTFNSKDSKIIFPNSFVYPGSESMLPDGKIFIVSDVSIKPTSNWVTVLNGTALDLENSKNGISGTIKINKATEIIENSKLIDEVLQPWFNQIQSNNIVYSDIFAGVAVIGKQAETPIMINSDSAYLICGMAAINGSTTTYIFVYRGNNDSTKNELVKNLLNSLSMGGNEITIQK